MMLINSLWYSILTPALGIFVSACTGYVVCKYDFRGKMFIYNMVLVVMMIPVMGSFTAAIQIIYQIESGQLSLHTHYGGGGIRFAVPIRILVF